MAIDKIAVLLAVIGALNWGGIGLFGFDTVAWLFGGQLAVISRIIYALVGRAGGWGRTRRGRRARETAANRALKTPRDGGFFHAGLGFQTFLKV